MIDTNKLKNAETGKSGSVYFGEFGKTVFSNREEAEAALKGEK